MMMPHELSLRRRRLKLTQEELASLLGVATATIARWEMGEMRPSTPVMLNKALKLIELERSLSHTEFTRLLSQIPALPDKASLPEPVQKIPDKILKDDEERIRVAVAAHPNATLAQLCELVTAAGGASASRSTMQTQLKRLNLATKRSRGTYLKNHNCGS
jgi:transcriptional regulator with XRE-family HTH domain